MKNWFIILILVCTIYNTNLFAQTDLENNLNQILNIPVVGAEDFRKDYLTGYMQPFVTAFGTAVGGAMYHRAYSKGFPRFDAGISAVYLIVPKDGILFNNPLGNEVPTVFGTNTKPADNTLPGGTGNDGFLLPQLHINLGLISDFEVTARYLGFNIKEFGDFTLMGFGIKYGISDLFPLFPIHMSFQAMYHTFKIDEWLDSGTIGMNLQISKDLPVLPVDIYGGVGFENTSMTIKTANIPGVTNNIGDVSIEGENNLRVTIGASWTLLIANLHAEYNFGKFNSIGMGAMIVL